MDHPESVLLGLVILFLILAVSFVFPLPTRDRQGRVHRGPWLSRPRGRR